MRVWLRRRFQRWLARRLPAARSVLLDHRRIFILPTRPGLAFLATLGVLFLGAVNYQNNLAFALVFLLFGLFLVSPLHTWANLAGLRLTAVRGRPAHAGETAVFEVLLEAERERSDLVLGWPRGESARVGRMARQQVVNLAHPAPRRGRLRPGPLRVSCRYPLGLFEAWSWVDLDLAALVYPRPLAGALPGAAPAGGGRGRSQPGADGDELHAFRPYRPGDPLRQVLWKAYAREGVLQTGLLARPVDTRTWLDFADFPGDAEQRLAGLCHWVLVLSQRGGDFGLRLPGVELAPAAGASQRDAALRALALWNRGEQA